VAGWKNYWFYIENISQHFQNSTRTQSNPTQSGMKKYPK